MKVPIVTNRRLWLALLMAGLVCLLGAMAAHAQTVVYLGATGLPAGAPSDRDAVNPAGIAQRVCDDFLLAPGAAAVTDIEWTGLYGEIGRAVATETFSPADEFTLVFFDDDAGTPGRPIAEYHPKQVTRLLGDNGLWTYRYTLPHALTFKPGRRYHLSIVNNLPGQPYWCWSQDNGLGANHSAPTGTDNWIRWPGNCAFCLTYTQPPAPTLATVPTLLIGLIACCAFGLHRYVL